MKTYNLTTKTSRKALTPRHEPYPARVHKGLTLLFRKPESGAETWQVRARVHGGYKQKSLGAVSSALDYTEACDAARDQLQKWKNDEPEVDESLTLTQLVKQYIEANKNLKANRNWEAETKKRAKQIVYDRKIGKVRVSALRPKHITALQRELAAGGMKPSSVNRSCTVVRAALNWAFREEIMTRRPHASVPRAKEGKPEARHKFTMSEVSEVIRDAPESLKPILTGMAYTGCRPVGARRLQVKDVDLKHGQVWFTSLKGDSGQAQKYYTTLNGAALDFFKAQIEDKNPEDYVFTQANGQPWSERNLPERFRSYREKAELEGWDTLYVIRHSVITNAIKQGIPATQAAEEYGTSLEYIQKNYFQRDDSLARQYVPVLDLAHG